MRRWQDAAILSILWLCVTALTSSCTRPTRVPEEQYRRALAFLRSGEFESAQTEAELGERLTAKGTEGDTLFCRFRLLRIEALLDGLAARGDYPLMPTPVSVDVQRRGHRIGLIRF